MSCGNLNAIIHCNRVHCVHSAGDQCSLDTCQCALDSGLCAVLILHPSMDNDCPWGRRPQCDAVTERKTLDMRQCALNEVNVRLNLQYKCFRYESMSANVHWKSRNVSELNWIIVIGLWELPNGLVPWCLSYVHTRLSWLVWSCAQAARMLLVCAQSCKWILFLSFCWNCWSSRPGSFW